MEGSIIKGGLGTWSSYNSKAVLIWVHVYINMPREDKTGNSPLSLFVLKDSGYAWSPALLSSIE